MTANPVLENGTKHNPRASQNSLPNLTPCDPPCSRSENRRRARAGSNWLRRGRGITSLWRNLPHAHISLRIPEVKLKPIDFRYACRLPHAAKRRHRGAFLTSAAFSTCEAGVAKYLEIRDAHQNHLVLTHIRTEQKEKIAAQRSHAGLSGLRVFLTLGTSVRSAVFFQT